jgi:hypothetical protein
MGKAKAGVLDRMHSARNTGRPVFFDGGFCGAGFPFVFLFLLASMGAIRLLRSRRFGDAW